MVVAGGWVGVLAVDWVIWSREGKRRYVESPSMARRMPDLGVPKVVVLATRNSKDRPTIEAGISVAFVGSQQRCDEAELLVDPLPRNCIVADFE